MAERGDPRDQSYTGTIHEVHLRSRYARCAPYVRNRRVLDAPRGTGWGASLLPESASVTAIDIDSGAAAFGKTQFPSLRFAVASLAALPFQAGAFDVVLCLEGLEHLCRSDARAFLSDARRVLAPGGFLIGAVPLLNAGRHSGNPYHLFEYTESDLLRLLETGFEVEEHEVVSLANAGPNLWFVGKRRAEPLPETSAEETGAGAVERAVAWLRTMRSGDGFCYAAGQPKTLIATSLAALLLEGAGKLPEEGAPERAQWIRYIQSCQDPATGLFHDPTAEASLSRDAEYLLWQATYFAVNALQALGASAPAPLRFTGRFAAPGAVEEWLDSLDWQDPVTQGDRLMFLLSALVHRAEREAAGSEEAEPAPRVYHRILDWLDRRQNPRTGFWGEGEEPSLFAAVLGASRLLPFFEYVHRPVSAIRQIVDRTLALQQARNSVGAPPDGQASEELAAIDVLTLALRHDSYRAAEIKRALLHAYWTVWNLQNEDGSFPNSRLRAAGTYSLAGCSALTAGLGAGDLWSTWSRLLSLAAIAARFPEDTPRFQWTFPSRPGVGYHRFTSEIPTEEAAVLPLWIRRLERPPVSGASAVTVAVTCYNLGPYLHEAIESAFRQTLQPARVILVDDGSTDPFTAFLLDLAPWDGVEIIRQPNEGVAAARNRAIEAASTPYICCLDGDDRLMPDYFAKAVEALDADPELGFVSCYYRLFDCGEGVYRYNDCRFPNMLARNEAVGVSLFRKEAWRLAQGYSSALSGMHDWDLWIGILESGYRASVLRDVLFEYRIRAHSMYTVTRRPENFARLFAIIVNRHAGAYRRHASGIIQLQARYFAELVSFHQQNMAAWEQERSTSAALAKSREQQAPAAALAAPLAAEVDRLRIAGDEAERRIAELRKWSRQLREDVRCQEQYAASLAGELAAMRSSLTWRAASAAFACIRRVRGLFNAAGMLCSAAIGGRRRDLLFLAKACANATGRRVLGESYNRDYYLARYPDVAASGVPGLLHYICAGWLEGRSPSENFDVRYYLNRYADVASSGVHPFLHYVVFGAREGRMPSRRAILAKAAPRHSLASAPPEKVVLDNALPADQPLVSVVIPCFNYGAFVEGAIQSVLRQTFTNYEIIVIEGGSTDGVTPQRLRELEKAYPTVRFLYRSERHLLGDNRNFGLMNARGRYVCYLDADDLFEPAYLETAVFLLEGYGYDLVYPALRCFGDSDATWFPVDAGFPEIAAENQVSVVALFRKSAWEAVGGFRDWGTGDDYVYEDWDFWLRVLGHGFRAKAIREPLMLYRVHNASLSAGSRKRNDNERHRQAIAEANRDLLSAPLRPPREVRVRNAWTNLGPLPEPGPGTVLIALPFLSVGGAEKHFRMLVQGLVRRGYRVVVMTTQTLPPTVPEDRTIFDSLTPYVYHLPFLYPDESCWPDFIHYALRRYHAGALVIAGSEYFYHLLPEIRAGFPDLRIVDQLFNDTGHIVNNRRYASLIDLNIAPSRLLADTLIRRHGAEPEKVVDIPNGANIEVPEGLSREEAFTAAGLDPKRASQVVVSFIGRLSEEKAPRTFVEIARRLASRRELYFCIAGDGPERPAVLKAIAAGKLKGRIFYAGLLRDVRPLLAASDVVVVPSSLDGMPQIVVEAQLFSKPVIASAVGSLPDMIEDGVTGYICPAGDVAAFCARIRELEGDPELRRRMGERARAAAAERYDLEKMVDAYVDAFGLPAKSSSAAD